MKSIIKNETVYFSILWGTVCLFVLLAFIKLKNKIFSAKILDKSALKQSFTPTIKNKSS